MQMFYSDDKAILRRAHHPVIAVRASLRVGWKVRRPKSLALLVSGLILIGANAMATSAHYLRCKAVFGFDEVANPHLAESYKAKCASASEAAVNAAFEAMRSAAMVAYKLQKAHQPLTDDSRE